MKRNNLPNKILYQTREKKVQFLKDLKNEKISLSDILPPKITVMIVSHESEYFNMKTSETLTKEQYNNVSPQRTTDLAHNIYIIF